MPGCGTPGYLQAVSSSLHGARVPAPWLAGSGSRAGTAAAGQGSWGLAEPGRRGAPGEGRVLEGWPPGTGGALTPGCVEGLKR